MDRRALIFGSGLVLAAACTATSAPGRREAIVEGVPSTGDEAVVALLEWQPACDVAPSVGCTGVLVSARVVLTSGHCIEPLMRAHRGSVFFGPDVSGPGTRIAIADYRVDPAFDFSTAEHDLGLLLLAEDAPVEPAALQDHDASALAPGTALRVVGYGVTEVGTDTEGLRREGVMSLTSVDGPNLLSGPAPGMSCDGDSGGPVYAQIDGREVLVGLTSGGDRGCVELARNARVDERLDAFLRPTIAELEALPATAPTDLAQLAGLCGLRCADASECPLAMGCDLEVDGLRYCSNPVVGPGAFAEDCASDVECRGRPCVRLTAPDGCRCFERCVGLPEIPDAGSSPGDGGPDPDPPSGCAVGARGPTPSRSWGLALAFAWLLRRRAHRLGAAA